MLFSRCALSVQSPTACARVTYPVAYSLRKDCVGQTTSLFEYIYGTRQFLGKEIYDNNTSCPYQTWLLPISVPTLVESQFQAKLATLLILITFFSFF